MIVNNFVPSEKVFESSLNINNIKTSPSEKNFQSALKDSLDKLNEKQINADNITNDFISRNDVKYGRI